ncbi:MAG: hypothetical protein ACYS67_12390, partial [Planctomycetota bacterium]
MHHKKILSGLQIVLVGLFAIHIMTCWASAAESDTITLKSLLEEMVNRDSIARLPKPAYTCRQFSSYDRNSTEPGSPTWWANWDRSYFVRIEN